MPDPYTPVRCSECRDVTGFEHRAAPPRGNILCVTCGLKKNDEAEDTRSHPHD